MKLFSSFAAVLPALCTVSQGAGINSNNQQAIAQSHPTQEQLSHEKLSDVIAASPVLSLHRAICEIESITDDELAVGNLLISILEAHNFTIKTQSVPPPGATNSTKERLNVYAYPDVSKYASSEMSSITHGAHETKPKVLLTSHIDTVPPHIPYSLSLPQGKTSRKDIFISGRGTSV